MKTKRNKKVVERQSIRLATYHGGRMRVPLSRRVFGGLTASYYESRRRSKAMLALLEEDARKQAERLREAGEGIVQEAEQALLPQFGELEPVPVAVTDEPVGGAQPYQPEAPQEIQASASVVAAPAAPEPLPEPAPEDSLPLHGRRDYQNTLRASRVRRRFVNL